MTAKQKTNKELFIKFLKEYKIYTAFVKSLDRSEPSGNYFHYNTITELVILEKPYDYIVSAFDWNHAMPIRDSWLHINSLWRVKLNLLKQRGE